MTDEPLHPEADFLGFLAEGRFRLLYSPRTGQYVYYPRVSAPVSGARDLEWVDASGRGTVYATTVMRPKPPQAPYNVALIDLAEGPRMMSRVENIEPEKVAIGMSVKARVTVENGQAMVVFDPVGT